MNDIKSDYVIYNKSSDSVSLYEGFGIPPLGVLSIEKKVIVYNASRLPEMCGDAAYYIDPQRQCCDLDRLLKGNVNSPEAVLSKHSLEKSVVELFDLLTN